MTERPDFTHDPVRGEDLLVTQARIFTWSLMQLTPEQRAQAIAFGTHKAVEPFSVAASVRSWQKAIVKLVDNADLVTVGIRLDHPTMNRGENPFQTEEYFEWNDLTIIPVVGEDMEDITLLGMNRAKRKRELAINLRNIHNLPDDTEVIAQAVFKELQDGRMTIPLPTLVEDVPSIFLSIREYMGSLN